MDNLFDPTAARKLIVSLAIAAGLLQPAGPAVAADCDGAARPGVDWSGCRKRNLIMDGSKLERAAMAEADFTSTDLRNSNLVRADFSKATLVRSMLDGSVAPDASFEKAVGFRTSFAGADLAGANFTKSEMQRADFTRAKLNGIDFEKSELGRAVFTEAAIDGTRFRYSNLARADFRKARFETAIDFEGAYLYRTRFEGVDLSKAKGIAQWQIDLACGDASTKLPQGINPASGWPCAEE